MSNNRASGMNNSAAGIPDGSAGRFFYALI